MSDSLYSILGVAKSASEAEVQKAYRKLAKIWHPDIRPGDKKAEDKFKQITAAYEILGDKAKRARYDRGELDEQGNDRPFAGNPFGGRRGAGGRAGGQHAGGFNFRRGGPGGNAAGGGFGDLDDILAEMFGVGGAAGGKRGAGPGQGGGRGAGEGQDVRARLSVEFVEAARGGRQRVGLPGGRSVEVTIPPGIESGQTLRLRGQGERGPAGGLPGDALVEITVRDHPQFTRKGLDIHVEQPIPLAMAVLGGKVRVPTLDGEVSLTVPRGSSSGRLLRLRAKGIKEPSGALGDQIVKLLVMLPEGGDAELEAFLRDWSARRGETDLEAATTA
jgi:DnaJ-class molecular chaperone